MELRAYIVLNFRIQSLNHNLWAWIDEADALEALKEYSQFSNQNELSCAGQVNPELEQSELSELSEMLYFSLDQHREACIWSYKAYHPRKHHLHDLPSKYHKACFLMSHYSFHKQRMHEDRWLSKYTCVEDSKYQDDQGTIFWVSHVQRKNCRTRFRWDGFDTYLLYLFILLRRKF